MTIFNCHSTAIPTTQQSKIHNQPKTIHHPVRSFALVAMVGILGLFCMPQQLHAQACDIMDFSSPITIGPTQAPSVWYTDRYAPSVFASQYAVPGELVLKHSISTADGAVNRPIGLQGTHQNTQGRKYDLPASSQSMKIDLYVPAAWATSNKRAAGFWGTAVDGASAISAYPIIEFSSDGANPRFRGWESGSGSWMDLGLPTGFVYNAWYTLEIETLPSGEFHYTIADLEYTTTTSAVDASVRIDNVILQGYNYDPNHAGSTETDPGVNYDIFWDNFITNIPTVQNVTTNELFCSIQSAIDDADTDNGHIIQISEGTYSERVTMTKSLTLQGATADKTLYILDGSGLGGNGNGITIASGISNVTIKDLTVQNYSGANGNSNAGIYGIGSNNALLIDNVALLNNTGGSGFYANGPVDGVTFQNSMVANHGPGSRGIVVWNGLKQNINISNNMVTNNNCCGIELQDGSGSAVNVSGNTIDIGGGDNAIGVVGLDESIGPNTINNNIITGGGRFGIEIKNPAGGVTLDGNQVTFSGSVDARDKGGIVVIRRGVAGGNADIPNGVTVTNNTVTGYTQGSTSDGFGIVIEGTNHTVTNNSLQGNDIGIQQQAGHLPYPGDGDQADLADNFFGRGNSPATCGNVITGNTFSGNGMDTRDIGVSSGIVNNLTTNESFCSIQAAIDDPETLNGHTLKVSEGNYYENVVVNKSVIIEGPNSGISPNTGMRVAEAIVYPATSESDGIFMIEADNVKIDGLKLDGDNTNLTTNWPGTNGADLDVYDGVVVADGNNMLTFNGLQVTNNIIKNIAYFGVDNFGWYNYANPPTTGHLVDDNLFMDLGTYTSGVIDFWGGGVLIYNDNYTRITNNVMTNVRTGIQTGNFHDPNPGDPMYQVIDNNTIQARRRGIFYNLHTGGSVVPLTVSNNTITGLSDANETVWDGILLSSLSDATGQVIDNHIDGTGISVPSEGFEVWNVNPNAPVLIQGGSASNVDIGIFVNNYEGYSSDAGNTDCVIDQVDLTLNLEKGIYVKDSPSNTNGATVHALIKGNTEITTNGSTGQGILVEGTDASADIDDNLSTITGNAVGILVDAGHASITKNTITGNEVGVRFQNAGTGMVNNNNILGNTTSGVENLTGTEIDATLNWWGDVSGPSGAGAGTGDLVSMDVAFCPWLGALHEGMPVAETGPVANITTPAIYCSIQDAIDAATPGDVLEIIVADHTEPGQIVVDKSLTIQGQGKLVTTLRPGVNTGTGGDARAFILANPGIEFNLKDLTVDGSGKLIWQAIRHQGYGYVDQVAFTQIKYNESTSYAGTALAAFGTGDVDVTNCMFSEIGRVGVLYFGTGITNSLFKDNMYTGKGVGNWIDYMLDISAGANVSVEGNAVSGNLGIASIDGSTSAGLLVSTFFAVGTTASITENDISGNTTGIAVGFDANDVSVVEAHNNNFSGNGFGISTVVAQVDATGNWWGDATGPDGEGPGSGDDVSTNVDFCGWLLQAYDGNPNPAIGGIPDPDLTTTIQACSGEEYAFDLDNYLNNAGMDLGQVTYVYDVTVVPNVNVLVPDPREMGAVSNNGEIINTIENFGSQSLKIRYTVTPTSAYGCVGPEFIVDVVINLLPQVDIIPNGPTELCAGTARTISGTVVPTSTYTYLWEVIQDPANTGSSTILPANAQSPMLTVATDVTPGILQIKFTATSNTTGCSASKTFDFSVTAPATASAGPDQNICTDGSAVQLEGMIGGGATTSTWSSSGDGSFDNATSLTAKYTAGPNDLLSGTVSLTLTTNDPVGPCPGASDMVTITFDEMACIIFDDCSPIMFVNAMFLATDPHQASFHAGSKVISDGIITSSNTENVTFKAGNNVELRPGFEVQPGALFTINIEDCLTNKSEN